jgi:Xaa-Pro aminopeptidase
MSMPVTLIDRDWPDFGAPAVPAPVTRAELASRLALIRDAMDGAGLDALAIYGDREHAANLLWASGFDPRFEEGLMLVLREGAPLLLAGNECLSYTQASPAVAAGDIAVAHCASFSLLSQPRASDRIEVLLDRALPRGGRIGTVGWKYWSAEEVGDPDHALDIPSLLADLLRARADDVVNATALFMHPGRGLRSVVSVNDIARLEFANHMAAAAVRRIAFALREGMSDFAAMEAGRIGGLPLGCHPTFATGARSFGLSGPTGQRLERGRPLSFNVCHWGANVCRAGWIAEGPEDLPEDAKDYLEAFVGPYLEAMNHWCALMRPGVTGGEVQEAMDEALPGFGVTLNPGHLIGTDEWISSPIFPGSDLPIRSGMAMQMDVIPDHPVYGSTRMEDGYVIADDDLRAMLEETHPMVAARVEMRRGFLRDIAGVDLPETLLPLADTCGVVAPWLLAPRRLAVLAR